MKATTVLFTTCLMLTVVGQAIAASMPQDHASDHIHFDSHQHVEVSDRDADDHPHAHKAVDALEDSDMGYCHRHSPSGPVHHHDAHRVMSVDPVVFFSSIPTGEIVRSALYTIPILQSEGLLDVRYRPRLRPPRA